MSTRPSRSYKARTYRQIAPGPGSQLPISRRSFTRGTPRGVFGTPLARVSATAVAMMLRAIEQIAAGAPPMVAAQYPQPFDVFTPENV